MTPEQAQEAVRARSWAGAGAGAVIWWLRDLEPPVAVTAPTRARAFCDVHPDMETTTRECGACKRERAERGQAYLNARRQGATWTRGGPDAPRGVEDAG